MMDGKVVNDLRVFMCERDASPPCKREMTADDYQRQFKHQKQLKMAQEYIAAVHRKNQGKLKQDTKQVQREVQEALQEDQKKLQLQAEEAMKTHVDANLRSIEEAAALQAELRQEL